MRMRKYCNVASTGYYSLQLLQMDDKAFHDARDWEEEVRKVSENRAQVSKGGEE